MKAKLVLFLSVLLLVVAVSCSGEDDTASLTLNLSAQTKDLTVSTDAVPSVFEYRMSFANEQSNWVRLDPGQSSVFLEGLMPGYWVFDGRAYSNSNILLYEGSVGITLSKNFQDSVTVNLKRVNINSGGTGTVSMTIKTPISRSRTSETLQVKYRLAGSDNYQSRTVSSAEVSMDSGTKTWSVSLNSLTSGVYEVVVSLLNNQTEALGKAFVADVRPGGNCTISGTLDGGASPQTYTISLSLADLISLAENENCTKVITGLTDSFTGQDIDAAVIDKGGNYQMRFCNKSSIGPNDKLSTFGITTELYDFSNDPDAVTLCSKEFIMITNDCNVLPAESWFKPAYKAWDDLPKVRTMYVNKNLTGNYSISGVVHLTRLILGNDMTQITGRAAISNTNSLPELSIPSGITQLGDKSIRVSDGPINMNIYCSLSSTDAAKIVKISTQTIHTTGPKPISQQ